MGCILSIIGKDLDIDAFVQNTGITGFKKKYKGDIISKSRNKKLEYSFVSIVTSEADFNNFEGQIKDTINFLTKNKDNLQCISITEGIDFATIRFGINSTINKVSLSQSLHFPSNLLKICSELSLGLEVSTYWP